MLAGEPRVTNPDTRRMEALARIRTADAVLRLEAADAAERAVLNDEATHMLLMALDYLRPE